MAAAWTPAPAGESLEVPTGNYVAVVASVKASHAAADLRAFAAARGLSIVDYAEEGQRAGLGPDPRSPEYRYVAAIAAASRDVAIPWEVPWPLSMVDDSQIVSAWTSPVGSTVPAAPPAPAPRAPRGPVGPSLWPLAGIAAGGLWLWWRGRRRR